jgi:hypothetical protein
VNLFLYSFFVLRVNLINLGVNFADHIIKQVIWGSLFKPGGFSTLNAVYVFMLINGEIIEAVLAVDVILLAS